MAGVLVIITCIYLYAHMNAWQTPEPCLLGSGWVQPVCYIQLAGEYADSSVLVRTGVLYALFAVNCEAIPRYCVSAGHRQIAPEGA